MSRIGVVTDSVSDLEPSDAAKRGIVVVPLYVTFGDREFKAGVDLSNEGFWRELTAAGSAFPKTAAAPPGAFREVFERLFAEGCDDIIYVGVGSKLSGTIASSKVARDGLAADKQDHVYIVDTAAASMGITCWPKWRSTWPRRASRRREIVAELERRREDVRFYIALETLEYLKRGGRISPAQAAIGNVLSVKPIITVEDGVVETADDREHGARHAHACWRCSRAQARRAGRLLHGQATGIDDFADDVARGHGLPARR